MSDLVQEARALVARDNSRVPERHLRAIRLLCDEVERLEREREQYRQAFRILGKLPQDSAALLDVARGDA